MPERPLLSVIVASRNRLLWLQECIAAIRANTTVPYELIVPDDGSGAEVMDWLRAQSDLVAMDSCGVWLGYCQSVNRALLMARGEYVTAPPIANDCEVQPGWAEAAVEMLGTDPTIGQVSLQVLNAQGKDWHCGAWHGGEGKGERGINYAAYGIVPRSLIDAGLRFDGRLKGQQFADVDFSWQVLAMGYRVVPCLASRILDKGGSEGVSDVAVGEVMGKWAAPGILREKD